MGSCTVTTAQKNNTSGQYIFSKENVHSLLENVGRKSCNFLEEFRWDICEVEICCMLSFVKLPCNFFLLGWEQLFML